MELIRHLWLEAQQKQAQIIYLVKNCNSIYVINIYKLVNKQEIYIHLFFYRRINKLIFHL